MPPKKRRPYFILALGLVVACGGLVAIVASLSSQLFDFSQSNAPEVAPTTLQISHDQQRIFRLIPHETTASYTVDERILTTNTTAAVSGQTGDVNGDILIDFRDPDASQLAPVTINLSSLVSDSDLRDARLRKDYLASNEFPLATFTATDFLGLPTEIVDGTSYPIQIVGELTMRQTTIVTAWTATIALDDNAISGSATTVIQMSSFGVGPIVIPGFVETSDNVILTIDFVGRDLDEFAQALADATSTAADETEATASSPSPTAPSAAADGSSRDPAAQTGRAAVAFSTEIAPILAQNCVSCHLPGEVGHEIFALETVGHAAEFANEIAFVAQIGYMPPWMPGPESPPLDHERRLSEQEIVALQTWAEGGGAVDLPVDQILEPVSDRGTEAIRADLVLEMPAEYIPATDRPDDYRCFLVDPGLDEGGFVTGFEVVPGERSIVHHVIAYQAESWAASEAAGKEAEDDRPGWECFGGTNLRSEDGGLANSIGTWVPGVSAVSLPAGSGRYIPPGNQIVIQVHYNTEAGALPDRTRLILELAQPGETITPLASYSLVAPVEIPCPEAFASELCTREHAIADQNELGDEFAREFADGLLRRCGKTLADYSNQDASHVVSDCTYEAPRSGYIVEASGHMHELGKSIRLELNPDSDAPQIILDIPYWDFNWQGSYFMTEPIWVNAGDEIRVTCSWDNNPGYEGDLDANGGKEMNKVAAHDNIPDREPRYIIWGEGTRDEMCLGTMSVIDGLPPAGQEGAGDNAEPTEQSRAVAIAAVTDYFTERQPAAAPGPAEVAFVNGLIEVAMNWEVDGRIALLEFSFRPVVSQNEAGVELVSSAYAGAPLDSEFRESLIDSLDRAMRSDLFWYGNVDEIVRFEVTEQELRLIFR